MKIKTFKKGEDAKINKFLEGVRVLQNGINYDGDYITFTYFEGKYPEIKVEDTLASLYGKINEAIIGIKEGERNIKYVERKEAEATDGKDKRVMKEQIDRLKLQLEIYKEEVEELKKLA